MTTRSKKITKSVQGQDCTLRLPDICNFNPETTIFAHIGTNRGMGIKCADYFGVYSCSSCHDEIDRRTRVMSTNDVELEKLRALEEIMGMLVAQDLISVA